MPEILIALGANLPRDADTPRDTLERALAALGGRAGLTVTARARWFATPAVPAGSGPDFVNGAARLTGEASPAAILEALHEVERDAGRSRPARWAPRVCDLDLLAVGDLVLPDAATVRRWMELDPAEARRAAPAEIVLPHPRLQERGFVLLPLADIAPGWRHPLTGRTVREMAQALPAEAVRGVHPL